MASLGVATLGSDFDPSGLESGLSSAQGATQRFLSGWQQAFSTAMGFIIRDVILALGRAIMDLGKQALDATAEWERMGLSMQSLVARELRASDATLTMSDALEQAGARTEELLGWIQKLAIQSPFNTAGIQAAFQTALTYGFTSKAAQRLTQNMVDFAAATGKGIPDMGRVALALGQIKQVGHLAGTEMRQLTEAGVPVIDILASMGKTIDDVSGKTVDATAFIEEFNQTIEHDFGGAAARQTETWTGLLNSFEDLKKMGLRTLFKGIFDQLQPLAAGFASWLQGPGMIVLKNMGEWIGNALSGLFSMIGAVQRLQYFFSNLDKGMTLEGAIHRLLPDLDMNGYLAKRFIGFLKDNQVIENLRTILDLIGDIAGKLLDVADRAKFFFDNLNKGMTVKGAIQRMLPGVEVEKTFDAIASSFKKVASGAGGLAIGATLGTFIIKGLVGVFTSKAFAPIVKVISTFFTATVGPALQAAFAGMGSWIFTGLTAGLTAFSPMLSGFFYRLLMTGGPAASIGAALVKIFGGWTWLAATFGPALSGIVSFLAPLVAIAGAVMLLVGAFQLFQEGKLAKPIADTQAAFMQMVDTFTGMMPLLIQLGSQIWQSFLDNSKKLAGDVIPWLVSQFQKIADWFKENRALIGDFLIVISDLISNTILPAIAGMWQFVEPILTGLIDLILGIAKVIMQIATGDWAGAWATIQATVVSVGQSIGQAVYGFLNWIANIMGTSLAEIGAVWSSNWDQFVNIVQVLGPRIMQALTDLFNFGIDDLIVSILGQGIVDGLVAAFNFGIDDLIAAAMSMLQALLTSIKSFLGIQSPSTVFFDIGMNLILGFINGIVSMFGMAVATFSMLFQIIIMTWTSYFLMIQTSILMGITTLTTSIQTIFVMALTLLAATIIAFGGMINANVSAVISAAIAVASNMVKGFVSVGQSIADGIADGIAAGAGAIIDAIQAVISDAIAAAMAAIDANSPSKVFMKIGSYVPAGFSIGIAENVGTAVSTVKNASLEIGMAMLPNGQMTPGYEQAGSYAATPVQGQFGAASGNTQIGPFYGTVNVGKMEDLGTPDPLETAKVQ